MHISHVPELTPIWLPESSMSAATPDLSQHLMAMGSSGGGVSRSKFGSENDSTDKSAGPRVLVVDDNAINRRVLAGMVRAQGCEVEMAGNGQDALDQIKSADDFQLVFMDCEMPGMDGFEATRKIRARFGNDIPIVAASAYSSDQDQERCRACGMNDFMSKPLKRPAVRGVLEKWIPGAFGRGAA